MHLHYPWRIGNRGDLMDILHLEASSLTDRYQTTVPTAVRKALGVGKRDKLEYVVQANGEVILRRAETEHKDPALSAFLRLLERDIAQNPQRLKPLSKKLRVRAAKLVAGMKVDLDKKLAR
jgi:antitoxin PrlF